MKNKLIREYIDEDDEDDGDYDYNLKRVDKEFFIDPKGVVHKYKGDLSKDIISMHNEIASQIFPDDDYAEDKLMKDGWVLVGSTVYNCPIINKKPTIAQIKTLKDLGLYTRLCALYKDRYPNYDKYQGLWD